MKAIKAINLLILTLVLSINISYSQDKEIRDMLPNHPRILLLEGEEQNIQKMIGTDQTWASIHKDILNECDVILTTPLLERKQIGMRLLAVSREAMRRIFFLSYAYRMTGDPKYFGRAEAEMLTVSNFKDWNPSHFLDVSEMTLGVAIGYDWLYNNLSDESRAIISNAIIEKGIKPSTENKYNWFLEAKHNWNQVCNAGMLYGAMAVYDKEPLKFRSVINRSVNSIKLPMQEYAPHGAYPEGYMYWEYGTSFNVLFLSALDKVANSESSIYSNIEGFMNTASYYQHMIGSSRKSFNYSDCDDKQGLTPATFWFAQKKEDMSLLWNEKKYMTPEHRGNYLQNRILPAVMIWGAQTNINTISAPQQLFWTGAGTTPVALMRTSWTDNNGVYVGFKGGTAKSNHSHMDIGSFVMDALGVRWASDFGSQEYESLESKNLQIWSNEQDSERWKVFRYNNYAHNVMTVNNKLHNVDAFSAIESYSDQPDFMFASTDLSAIFKGDLKGYKRGIAIVNKSYVVVRDELEALQDVDASIRWNMLTSAAPRIISNDKIELEKDGKKLQLKVVADFPFKLKIWTTQSPNDYDASNTGTHFVGFESLITKGKKGAFTVYLLPEGISNGKVKPLKDWK